MFSACCASLAKIEIRTVVVRLHVVGKQIEKRIRSLLASPGATPGGNAGATTSLRRNFITAAGMEACSNLRPPGAWGPGTTVPLRTHGDTSTAGTRTPRRSNAKGAPVSVSWAEAVKP